MLSNKAFWGLQSVVLTLLGAVFVYPSLADPTNIDSGLESSVESAINVDDSDPHYGLEKTLEYNFSPVDRARLRKALSDYSKNNDPEHIKIKRERKKMRDSLKQRFSGCDRDLDEALDRQEVTECLPQIARHFNSVDVDEDNVITFDELELAQAKWRERHRAAEAKLEAQRLKQMEADIKRKAAQPKKSQQAATDGGNPG